MLGATGVAAKAAARGPAETLAAAASEVVVAAAADAAADTLHAVRKWVEAAPTGRPSVAPRVSRTGTRSDCEPPQAAGSLLSLTWWRSLLSLRPLRSLLRLLMLLTLLMLPGCAGGECAGGESA